MTDGLGHDVVVVANVQVGGVEVDKREAGVVQAPVPERAAGPPNQHNATAVAGALARTSARPTSSSGRWILQ